MQTLWTIQDATIALTLAAGRTHFASWDRAGGQAWQTCYTWARDQLATHLARDLQHPPVWAWHSVEDVPGRGPSQQTARDLIGDLEHAPPQLCFELQVPEDCILICSYRRWNACIDAIFDHQGLPPEAVDWPGMFVEPGFDGEGDDLQAILPWIEPGWVSTPPRPITDLPRDYGLPQ